MWDSLKTAPPDYLCSITIKEQLTLSVVKAAAQEYNFRSYIYHEQFEGHEGYAAPIILLADGGTMFFGDSEEDKSVNLVKLDKEGNVEW